MDQCDLQDHRRQGLQLAEHSKSLNSRVDTRQTSYQKFVEPFMHVYMVYQHCFNNSKHNFRYYQEF